MPQGGGGPLPGGRERYQWESGASVVAKNPAGSTFNTTLKKSGAIPLLEEPGKITQKSKYLQYSIN